MCFTDQVVPLVRCDGASCHQRGEFGVQLGGTADDFAEWVRYIHLDTPEESVLFQYAEGLGDHPVLWSAGSEELAMMLAWVEQGAAESCDAVDATVERTCESDTACETVICSCTSGDVTFQRCGDEGTCLTDADCAREEYCGESEEVTFSADVVPALRTDCASCHADGGHGVRISGAVSDYSTVMGYVDLDDPEGEDGFLWWTAGGGR